jgi:hypothetical protein
VSDQIGNSVSSSTNSSGSGDPGQIDQRIAAITLALKGKLCMQSPCPHCGRAKCLFEKVFADGGKRHECRSCGYLMYWKPSDRTFHEQWNNNTHRMERYNRESFKPFA